MIHHQYRSMFSLLLVVALLSSGVMPAGLTFHTSDAQANTVKEYISSGSSSLTLNSSIVTVNPGLTIATNISPITSSTNISGATVLIGKNLDSGKDILSYTGTLPSGVTADNYNSTTGLLRFNGSTTPANWQTLLRTVRFSTTS